jgi:hypothetical protein
MHGGEQYSGFGFQSSSAGNSGRKRTKSEPAIALACHLRPFSMRE